MPLIFIHVAYISSFFLLMSNFSSVCHNYFIHSQVAWHLSFFQLFWLLWIKMLYEPIKKPMHIGFFCVCVCMFLHLLDKYLRLELLDSMVKCIFNFVRNCENIPKWLYHFVVLPEMYEVSSCSAFWAKLGIVNHFNLTHSSWCVVVSQCVFVCFFHF